MKRDNYLIYLISIVGVFFIITLIIVFMALGKGESKDFVALSEIVAGIAVQALNVSGSKEVKSEEN
jgi:hypothetical protein